MDISLPSRVPRPSGGKKLPHLATTEATPAQTEKLGQVAKLERYLLQPKGSPFESVELSAYDVSYWIKRGQNVIVASRS